MKKEGKIGLSISVIILLSLIIEGMGIFVSSANAATTFMKVVNPTDGTQDFNFTADTTSVGHKFIVNITVADVANLQNWQAMLTWNDTLLDFVNISLPSDHVFAGVTPARSMIQGPPITFPGIVTWGCTYINNPYWTFNGTGTLCQVALQIKQGVSYSDLPQASCGLVIANIGSDSFLIDGHSRDITFTIVNGRYFYSAVPPGAARLYVDPARVVDSGLTAGSFFNVSLKVADASYLNSWKAKLAFDKTVLLGNSAFEGAFLKAAGSTAFSFEILNDYNATHGLVIMNCSLLSDAWISGNGELAIMTFEVSALGESNITLVDPELLNPTGALLPFVAFSGYFSNILLAKLSIEPSEVSGPSYLPGTTFTINVTLDDVENLKSCIFNLTYVPSIIHEINLVVPSVQGKTPVKKLQVDDDAGYIWANVTYPGGITVYEPATVMRVEFQVVSMGVSPINLTDTSLYDVSGMPITHEVHHGIFIGLIRDVAVTGVVTDLDTAYEGWTVLVNVTVLNKGNLTETFELRILYDGNVGAVTTVADLAEAEERTVTVNWETAGVAACHNYTISAFAVPVPYEFNTGDNTLEDGKVKIRIMGDYNGDDIVDMRDIGDVCNLYGSNPTKPNWNAYADFNRDGRIDLRDIGLVCRNYLRHCEPS